MIKRALGIFAGDDGGENAGDSDDELVLTRKQRKKLERRLLPGSHLSGAEKKARSGGQKDIDSDDSEDSEDNVEEGEEEEDFSDDDPLPPEAAKEKAFRGEFHCQLCPDKILLNKKLMEAHLQSAGHKRNEKNFLRAKEMGVAAYEEECRQKAKERAEKASLAAFGVASKRQQRNAEFWDKKRAKHEEKRNKAREAEKAAKAGGKTSAPGKGLSEAQIEVRKAKFAAKKARRMERKAQGAGAAVEAEGDKKTPEASKGKKKREASSTTAEPMPPPKQFKGGSGKKKVKK
eukprot:TRINITY_DN34786_c0_g1_i1.p1 TRINITY_DN34786_c0_g1~~TRINITY_DN34786_c0_g1_i1.p1  ORF type:complete len:289 (+),score=104.06 TRINITY_DN34786_c0_g1_i1:63-929(+)